MTLQVKALETERKRLQHDLEIAVELTMKRLKAGAAELANSPQHEKVSQRHSYGPVIITTSALTSLHPTRDNV